MRFLDSGSGEQEITGRIGRIGNYFRHRRGSGTNEASMSVHHMFASRPQLGCPPGSSRKGTRTQAGRMGSRAKSARHPQSERRTVWVASGTCPAACPMTPSRRFRRSQDRAGTAGVNPKEPFLACTRGFVGPTWERTFVPDFGTCQSPAHASSSSSAFASLRSAVSKPSVNQP